MEIDHQVKITLDHGVGEFVSFKNFAQDKEHFAICFGDWKTQKAPLVRIHSECITGDVFASRHCDCGDQLSEAMKLFCKEGGVLLYLRQEGRGIGLYNKLKAYTLQKNGLDTLKANRALGFSEDMRSYTPAIEMLRALGIHSIRLLTNNPQKVQSLINDGIDVEEVIPTQTYLKKENLNYLSTKQRSCQHSLRIAL